MTAKPVVVTLDAAADGAQRVDHRLDPVGLLVAELPGPVDPALAARLRREQRKERQLVDEQRHLARMDRRRGQLGAAHLEISDLLAAHPSPLQDADPPAHPLEHIQQPGAARD